VLPSLVAEELRRTLTDFLGTTFALTDDDVRAELEAVAGLVAPPGFVPYAHQARAFERLDSLRGTPRPTIVTTGTGSGKTESFLLPMLDHCHRQVAIGEGGVKALVLYPMNALALLVGLQDRDRDDAAGAEVAVEVG
jgi:ATP-dependent helicase YprA (DUF1998 family)